MNSVPVTAYYTDTGTIAAKLRDVTERRASVRIKDLSSLELVLVAMYQRSGCTKVWYLLNEWKRVGA